MVAREISLRTGVASDAVSLTGLYLRSRRTAMPWLPSVHDEAETLGWMRQIVLAGQDVIVAQDGDRLIELRQISALLGIHPEAFSSNPNRPDPLELLRFVDKNAPHLLAHAEAMVTEMEVRGANVATLETGTESLIAELRRLRIPLVMETSTSFHALGQRLLSGYKRGMTNAAARLR
jgi:hypothetical protein